MTTARAQFFQKSSFAFVGHSAAKPFPALSFGHAKRLGKQVFPIDPSVPHIAGEKTFTDFASLPGKVEAAVLEVPREETARWVGLAADAGIKSVWIHMNRETPEALALAKERGVEVFTGSCAVMYLVKGPSYHSVHKWVNKLAGKY